jgi:Fur family ferric uptake transcriptional regulator
VNSRIEKQCRASGLRLTRQRRLIGQVISDAGGPLDFVELYRRVAQRNQHVSRATIYRTLRLLMAAGIIESHAVPDGRPRYECAGWAGLPTLSLDQ